MIYLATSNMNNDIKLIRSIEEEEYVKISSLLHDVNIINLVYSYKDSLNYNSFKISELINNYTTNELSPFYVKLFAPTLIQNFLSSERGFVDSFAHLISDIFGKDTEIYNKFDRLKKDRHSKFFSYRFIEEYRNYVQHRGLPFDICNFTIEKNEKRVEFILYKETIFQDKSISKKKKEDIDNNCSDQIGIFYHIKTMHGLLLNIHDIICNHILHLFNFDGFFEYESLLPDQEHALIVVDYEKGTNKIYIKDYFSFKEIRGIVTDIKKFQPQ